MTDIEQIKKDYEPYEVLEMLCWADVVMHVMYHKEAEDISFCKGKSCNYCGRFPINPSTQHKADDHPEAQQRSQTSEQDVKELFRKEIAKWKDEDPLFMAYVHGQEAGRIEGARKARKAREDVLDELAEPTIRASEEAEQNGDYVSQTCYEDVLKWIAAIRQQEGKP